MYHIATKVVRLSGLIVGRIKVRLNLLILITQQHLRFRVRCLRSSQ